MRNPWCELPREAPFVLDEDASVIEQFNQTATAGNRVHLKVLPEPFLGDPNAPVVLLNLNPGFSDKDQKYHSQPTFATLLRDNLEHSVSDHPFHYLNPVVRGPGREWWERKLGPLLELAPRHVVARRVFCVEYFPYHSVKFGYRGVRLASQAYTFHLVRQSLRRGALMVLMRGRRLWFDGVPELQSYTRRFELRSVQNPTISSRNCPEGFGEIVARMQ